MILTNLLVSVQNFILAIDQKYKELFFLLFRPLTSLPAMDLQKPSNVSPNHDVEIKPQQISKHAQNKNAFIKTEGKIYCVYE